MPSTKLIMTQTTLLSPYRSPERLSITNFHLPVLIYRACLPPNPTPSRINSFLEPNHWIESTDSSPKGLRHVMHKCLAISKGCSRLLLGKGPFDAASTICRSEPDVAMEVTKVDLYERDVIVLPAGVVHHLVSSDGCFEYITLFPKESPRFFGTDVQVHQPGQLDRAIHVKTEQLPEYDPIFGKEGPLMGIWKEAQDLLIDGF